MPTGFQRYPLRRSLPLGNSIVCGTMDGVDWLRADIESTSIQANRQQALMVVEFRLVNI